MKPDHLGHVHLKVSDLARAEKFYTEALGLKVMERFGSQYVFLSLGKHHHDIALMNVGKNAPRPAREATGLFHVAFEVKNKKDFAKFYQQLKKHGVEPEAVDYGMHFAMYFPDPDHNIIEVYVDNSKKVKQWNGYNAYLSEKEILKFL